jgi:hypothetical protein
MQQIVDFILELQKLKGVTRKVRPLGLGGYENSAEHGWQLAILADSRVRYARVVPVNPAQRVFDVIRLLQPGDER